MSNIVSIKKEELKEKVIFQNKGLIDLRAIKTFGISSKENDNAIGYFGTGLKYAIAVLVRENIYPVFYIGGKEYRFTKKTSRVRVNDFDFIYMNKTQLPFTTELGKNWELWQAFRELYCNCTDEKGKIYKTTLNPNIKSDETVIVIEGEDIIDCYDNKAQVILEGKPVKCFKDVDIYEGSSESIFYKNIRIYDKPCKYTYNIKSKIDLTEDRTAKYEHQVKGVIGDLALTSDNEDFIWDLIVLPDDGCKYHFENLLDLDFCYKTPSETFIKVAKKAYQQQKKMVSGVQSKLKRGFGILAPQKCEINKLETKALEKARLFLKSFVDVDKYELIITDDLPHDTIGQALNSKIYLSKRVFSLGLKSLISTYYEEWLHLETGYGDMTRAMQNYLFEKIIDQQAIIQEEVL